MLGQISLRTALAALCLLVALALPRTARADKTYTLNSDPIAGFTANSGTTVIDLGGTTGKVTFTDFTALFSASDTAAIADFLTSGYTGRPIPKLVLDVNLNGTPYLEDTFVNVFEEEHVGSIDSSGATNYTVTFAYQSFRETLLGTGGGTTGGGGTGTGVPEPSSLMLLASGGLALCAAARKRTVR